MRFPLILVALATLASFYSVEASSDSLKEFLQCKLCSAQSYTGKVSDCSCDFDSVNLAVAKFFSPLLMELTASRFFRYFRVDLERPCPFWEADAQCMMEGCSVCACDDEEVPETWLKQEDTNRNRHPQNEEKETENENEKDAGSGWISDTTNDNAHAHIHKSSSIVKDRDELQLRQQPWKKGTLSESSILQPDQESSELGFLRHTEDQEWDVLGEIGEETSASSTSSTLGFSRTKDTKGTDEAERGGKKPISTSQSKSKTKAKEKAKANEKEKAAFAERDKRRWTDMVEDDCPRDDGAYGNKPGLVGVIGEQPAESANVCNWMFDPSVSASESERENEREQGDFPVLEEKDDGNGGSESEKLNKKLNENENERSRGMYVNLLENPESFTGYSGEAAWRVWRSIQDENCFMDKMDTNNAEGTNLNTSGDKAQTDQCLEKRVFYRLMSGLQASISTHIAKEYFFEEKKQWGTNIQLYVRAVGSHEERVNNLYFTFLFVLRAAIKAGDVFARYPYDTGNAEQETQVRALISRLVNTSNPSVPGTSTGIGIGTNEIESEYGDMSKLGDIFTAAGIGLESPALEDIRECRNGFDENQLFQVPESESNNNNPIYNRQLQADSVQLQDTFRERFRNITRIMDCVTCDKCRVWGKLQILGIGTAIKILLTDDSTLSELSPKEMLTRQEVIAMINTLNQLSTSVLFASRAVDIELDEKVIWFKEWFTFLFYKLPSYILSFFSGQSAVYLFGLFWVAMAVFNSFTGRVGKASRATIERKKAKKAEKAEKAEKLLTDDDDDDDDTKENHLKGTKTDAVSSSASDAASSEKRKQKIMAFEAVYGKEYSEQTKKSKRLQKNKNKDKDKDRDENPEDYLYTSGEYVSSYSDSDSNSDDSDSD